MKSYPIEVRSPTFGRTPQSQGTAWFLRDNLVVTALHVAGNKEIPDWAHAEPGMAGATYHLLREGQPEIALEPDVDAREIEAILDA